MEVEPPAEGEEGRGRKRKRTTAEGSSTKKVWHSHRAELALLADICNPIVEIHRSSTDEPSRVGPGSRSSQKVAHSSGSRGEVDVWRQPVYGGGHIVPEEVHRLVCRYGYGVEFEGDL